MVGAGLVAAVSPFPSSRGWCRREPASARAGAAPAAGMSLDGASSCSVTAYGLFGFGYVITATFLVAIVRGSPEIGHLEPVIWVVVGLSAIPSVALWTALGSRIGIFAAYAAACLVEALGVAASVLAPNVVGVARRRSVPRRHLHRADRARPRRRAHADDSPIRAASSR